MTVAPHGQPVSDAFTAGAADGFLRRHIGPDDAEITRMLSVVGYPSLDALMDAALPPAIRDPVDRPSLLPPPVDEAAVTAALREIAGMNRPLTSMIGLGYYRSHTPAVIRRNVLENPAWYTAYTPYQPEISQGRLEALLVFQTMIEDLTGLDVAGASLLDEPTAAAEAVALCRRMSTSASRRVVVDRDVFPQTRAVLQTRAKPMQWEVVVADLGAGLPDGDFFAVLVQNPGTSGRVRDYRALTAEAHARGAFVIAAADVLSLALLPPPGEWGADVAGGSVSRSGSASRTPDVLRHAPASPVHCPDGWSASRWTATAGRRTGWRCKPASSTSGGRRRPATSARRRSCSRWSRPCTPCTTDRMGCNASPDACTTRRGRWPRCFAAPISRSPMTSSTRWR